MSDPQVDVIFCDHAVNNGKWNLIGVFDRINLPAFPATFGVFFAYLNISDLVVGEGVELQLELRDNSADNDGNMRAEVVWAAKVPINPAASGGLPTAFGFAVPIFSPGPPPTGITFQRPGKYEFCVTYQDSLIDVTILNVVERRPAP